METLRFQVEIGKLRIEDDRLNYRLPIENVLVSEKSANVILVTLTRCGNKAETNKK